MLDQVASDRTVVLRVEFTTFADAAQAARSAERVREILEVRLHQPVTVTLLNPAPAPAP